MPSNHVLRWGGAQEVAIPSDADPQELASRAVRLSSREQAQLAQAFKAEMYEIGATYVWGRTAAGLRDQLRVLGVEFLAEMLDRPDIRPTADIGQVLTDYDTLRLAEDLGMVTGRQAMRLRQAFELVAFSAQEVDGDSDSGMDSLDARQVLRACLETVLAREQVDVASGFTEFRSKLGQESLNRDSAEVRDLLEYPYFFKRTIVRTLLAGSKAASGAQLDNTLSNLNVIVPELWPVLHDPDRYSVGRAYSDLHAEGKVKPANAIRSALLKVSGFDYVPESHRSNEFLSAASAVLEAHFGYNNFHNEPEPMRHLASLGTAIPGPAFWKCMSAILVVLSGNRYGVSAGAQEPAQRMLDSIPVDRWQHFVDQCLPVDDTLLAELHHRSIAARFIEAIATSPRALEVHGARGEAAELWTYSKDGNAQGVIHEAKRLRAELRGGE